MVRLCPGLQFARVPRSLPSSGKANLCHDLSQYRDCPVPQLNDWRSTDEQAPCVLAWPYAHVGLDVDSGPVQGLRQSQAGFGPGLVGVPHDFMDLLMCPVGSLLLTKFVKELRLVLFQERNQLRGHLAARPEHKLTAVEGHRNTKAG